MESPGSPAVRAITMKKPAPSAPVMNHLRPVIRQPPGTRRASVSSAVGSEPAPGAGSVIANADRTSPATNGRRNSSCWSAVATSASRCTLPSSGAATLIASGPNSEYPAASNTGARSTMPSPSPPYSHGCVRAEQPLCAGGRLQLPSYAVAAGPLDVAAGGVLDRQHLLSDEGGGPRDQGSDLRRVVQVDRHAGTGTPSVKFSRYSVFSSCSILSM